MARLAGFWRDRRGAALIDHALVLALVVLMQKSGALAALAG